MRGRITRKLCSIPIALLWLCLLQAVALAETHTFLNTTPLYPTGGAGEVGPANKYPSSIVVSGVSGTVTKATVTLAGYTSANPTDTFMVITGPNGQKVMLMSDVCGSAVFQNNNWTFDDSAPTFLSKSGPCANYQQASFMPTNYGQAEPDDLSAWGAAPAPPYVNALSFFYGSPPSGTWNLYVVDDDATCCLGFDIAGWALTLEVQPPSGPTGQRAAALKKCKHKHGKKRKKCRKKANLLPV
jgi:hypothetical protein